MDRSIDRARTRWLIAAAMIVAAVLVMTLRSDGSVNTANFVPLRDHGDAARCVLTGCPEIRGAIKFLAIDVAGNLLAFIPVGVAFAGIQSRAGDRRRFWVAVGMAATLSLGIEAVQWVIPTRATDIDDFLFNTIGAATGAMLLLLYQRSRSP